MSHKKTKALKIVTIGGGSGQFALLRGLRDVPNVSITSVVSMVDSGGSTGRLRDEMGILPPGDILKCVLALSPHQELARTILLKRFQGDRRLRGHNAGNMLLTMLSNYTGSFPSGVAALSEILETRGTILPVTTDQATLVAELTDGTRIYGESAIDMPRGHQREKIRDVFLVPHHCSAIHVYPPVIKAITEAQYVVLGPGDLFTSIIPNLIVPGVADTLKKTKAKLIFIVNIMTKFGETHHFKGFDFILRLESFLGRMIDASIYNTRRPAKSVRAGYRLQKSEYVEMDVENSDFGSRIMIGKDLLESGGQFVRHDPAKLAGTLCEIFKGGLQ
jgi:uncharacterized cofD-like protein